MKPVNLDLEIAMKVDVNTTKPELKAKLGLAVTPEMKAKLDLALDKVIKLNQLRFVGNYARGFLHGKTKDASLNQPVDKIVDDANRENTATLFANRKPVVRKNPKTNDAAPDRTVKSNNRRTR